eukprot:TRINITY_DN7242_c0_g1_i2.p1 TRINITY_DN7242_c0_g1~~TRINITY_DN7242_c0_g1_i2.p1  ORF type:complete len:175 (-),score=30.35 TRINITY_DN7242_c0_g1_i2:31-555(-)
MGYWNVYLRSKKTSQAMKLQQIDFLLAEVNKCKQMVALATRSQANGDDENNETGALGKNALATMVKKVKDAGIPNKIAAEHKDFHAALSKYGKALDKTFTHDLSKVPSQLEFDDVELINRILAQHFFRQGQFDVGQTFVEEAHVQVDHSLKEPFMEMYKIVEAINAHNLQPAIE